MTKNENKIRILDVNISTLKQTAMRELIFSWLSDSQKQHQVVTPNPEFLLTAQKDEKFHFILNQADLAVPDGIGLKFAAWLKGGNIHRLAGSDLVQDILAQAVVQQLPIAIINWQSGLSKKADISQALSAKYPGLPFLIQDISRKKLDYDLEALKQYQPKILLCSLGAPWQDKLIHNLLPQLPSASLGLGVGGSFDFLTGAIKRAPKIIQVLGLEWLWRLLIQPQNRQRRLKRIYQAVIVFSWLAFKTICLNRFFYRKNVVAFLFDQQGRALLLNSNKTQEDYWRLPQGGIDKGENPVQALQREMLEEIGANNFQILEQYNNIYKYRWPKNYGIMGYRGQKQTLFILRYLGQPEDIKLSSEHKNYRWAPVDQLLNEAAPISRPAYELFIQKYQETVK